MRKTILGTLLSIGLIAPVFAEDVGHDLDLSANVGLYSDYIWRGVTQTNGEAAIQGGFDLSHASTGLYIGNWNSNVVGGTEIDLYGGVSNELFDSGVNYDIGFIRYLYPTQGAGNFNEVYGGLSAEIGEITPGITYWHNPDSGDGYVDASADLALGAVTVGGHYGYALLSDDNVEDWGVNASVSAASLDWSVAYTDSDADKDRVIFGVSKAF